jgi:hypothetical protein
VAFFLCAAELLFVGEYVADHIIRFAGLGHAARWCHWCCRGWLLDRRRRCNGREQGEVLPERRLVVHYRVCRMVPTYEDVCGRVAERPTVSRDDREL